MNKIKLLDIIIIFQIILIASSSLALAQTSDFEDLLDKPVPTTTNFIENLKIKFNSVVISLKRIANDIINWGIQNSIIFKIRGFLENFFNSLVLEIKQGFKNFSNYFNSFIKIISENLPQITEI